MVCVLVVKTVEVVHCVVSGAVVTAADVVGAFSVWVVMIVVGGTTGAELVVLKNFGVLLATVLVATVVFDRTTVLVLDWDVGGGGGGA